MVKSGCKYWAIVQPKNAVGRLAMEKFNKLLYGAWYSGTGFP